MMDDNNYLVLRELGLKGTRKEGKEVDYSVDTEELTERDIDNLRRDPAVVEIAPPIPIQLVHPVSDEEIEVEPADSDAATWGVIATEALNSPYTGQGVTVAVLDTGIDAGHEAFQGVEIIQKDFTGEGDGDENGHGTHVAGTIFGRAAGGRRYSVAPGVQRAVIGKVLGVRSSATTKEIVDAIQWAMMEQGAHVINMSLGFDFPGLVRRLVDGGMPADLAASRALEGYRDNVRFFDKLVGLVAARMALMSGALLVAAAGNESKRRINPDYRIAVAPPAAADGIIAVAALQTAGAPHDALRVASFSNTRPDLSAPGVQVYSARAGGGYKYLSGTSMASPHVSGVAALWAERQIQQTGAISVRTLGNQVNGQVSRQRLAAPADTYEVGAGVVRAPLD